MRIHIVLAIITNLYFLPSLLLTPSLASGNDKEPIYGISINLYRVKKAEKFEDLKDIDAQIVKTKDTKVNLYKVTGDLGMILMNTTNPYANKDAIPYKMLYGRAVRKTVGVGEIGGFLPSSEILEIVKWIKHHEIESYDGFSKMYDGLHQRLKRHWLSMAQMINLRYLLVTSDQW